MKKKFLSLALATAAAAMIVAPVHAEEAGTSTSVNIADGSNFTIAVSGDVQGASFNLDTSSRDSDFGGGNPADDWVRIGDDILAYPGHYVRMQLNTPTWTYTGTASGNDVAITAVETTANDEVYMRYDFETGAHSAVDTNGDACDASAAVANDVVDSTIEPSTGLQEIVRLQGSNSGTDYNCGGTYTYVLDELFLVGPEDGFKVGTYAITGTIVATDGQI